MNLFYDKLYTGENIGNALFIKLKRIYYPYRTLSTC